MSEVSPGISGEDVKGMGMVRILFLCHGNICRSTMAEFVMKDLVKQAGRADDFEIASAGVSDEEWGNPVHPGTVRMLAKHGITDGVSGKRARQITRSDYAAYDLHICMDQSNVRRALSIYGGDPEGKLRLLLDSVGESRDVADPWYTGDFDNTWSDVYRGCCALMEALG